jgi:general secretion pathway protein G
MSLIDHPIDRPNRGHAPAAPPRLPRGFTLIELLVVLAVVALLLSIVAPRTVDHVDRARETTLRATLKEMRSAIDQFEADRGRPPADLGELVDQRYLKSLPVDPITERSDTWLALGPSELRPQSLEPTYASNDVTVAPDPSGMVDVRSGADGEARDGTPFREF